MGSSQSKNTAQEIANITNTIAQTTNTSQVNDTYVTETVTLNDCTINADDFTVNQQAENIVNAKQLSTALQQSVIQNDITQQLAQLAQSKVGTLGVGYASASNSASTMANATSMVKNVMTTTMNNLVDVSNTFTCNGSDITLRGDLTINQGSFSNIITDQTAQNSQITDLSNTISQDIQQKASATVQGISGLILILLLIIGAILFIIIKSVGGVTKAAGNSSKIVMYTMIPVVFFGIFILLVWMASVKAPPLFTAPNIISPYAFTGQNGTDVPSIVLEDSLIDVKPQYIPLQNPPLYYLYNIFTNTENGCLLYIVINKLLGVSNDYPNHGYNCYQMENVNETFQNFVQKTIQNIQTTSSGFMIQNFPNLMVCCTNCYVKDTSDNIDYTKAGNMVYPCTNCNEGTLSSSNPEYYSAKPNVTGFSNFCNENDLNKAFARFVLAEYFGFFTNYYVNEGDPVTWLDENQVKNYGVANESNKKYLFRITQKEGYDITKAMENQTQIYGIFGTQPTTVYQVSQGFKRWGIYLFIIFVLILCLWIGLTASRIFIRPQTIRVKI